MTNREIYTLTSALSIIDNADLFGENPSIEKIRSFVNNINKKEKEKKEKIISKYKKLEGNIYLIKDKKIHSMDMESYEVMHIHKINELKTIYVDNNHENAVEFEYTPLVLFSFDSFSKYAINENKTTTLTCKQMNSLILLNQDTLKRILNLQHIEFQVQKDFINLIKKLK